MGNNSSLTTKIIVWALLIVIFGFLVLIGTEMANGSTSSPRRDNSLGVVLSSENPYIYNMGLVVNGTILRDSKGREYTSVLFSPYGTSQLYTEDLLLCTNIAKELNTHVMKVVVLTYERREHMMYQGIGCHNVLNITEVNQ